MYWRVAHMCNTSYVLSCVASRFHLCFAFLTLSIHFSSTPVLSIVVFYFFFWHRHPSLFWFLSPVWLCQLLPSLSLLPCFYPFHYFPFPYFSPLFPVFCISMLIDSKQGFYFHVHTRWAHRMLSVCLYLTVFRKLWPHEYVCWQLQDVPLCVCVFTDRVNVCILGTHDSVAVALSATWGPSGSVLISVEAQNGFCLMSQRSHTPAAATFSKAAFRDNRA